MAKIDTSKGADKPRRTTFGEVVAIMPQSVVLTEEVLNILDRDWGSQSVEYVLNMEQVEMVQQLLAIMPDSEGFDNMQRFQVATALYELMHKLFPSTPAASAPTKVHVTIDKTPDQMSLRELLAFLVEDFGRYGELKAYIEQSRQLQPALRQTAQRSYAWVIPNANGTGIDIELTMSYVDSLSSMFAVAQELYRDRRPITLKRAVGKDQQALIHPFTGKPVLGPDRLGFNFADLNAELHEALIWARRTQHAAWPSQITDLFALTEQLFEHPEGTRWQRILAAYQAVISDDETQRVSRFWPKDLGLDQVYGFDVTVTVEVHDEEYYRRALYAIAQPRKNNMSSTLELRHKVLVSFSNMSGKCIFGNVIVLEGGSNMSGTVLGTVYLPNGRSISNMSGSMRADDRNMSYQRLYELAKSWGLL